MSWLDLWYARHTPWALLFKIGLAVEARGNTWSTWTVE